MSQDINVLALVKGEERYVFLFNDANRAETLRMLGRYASDPQLSFSWYDAAILSQRIREVLPDEDSCKPRGHSRFRLPARSDESSLEP